MKLSFKLLIPLIAGTAVVVLLVSLLSYNYTRSVLRKTVSANQLGIARQTMEQIDGLLYERYNDIQQAAGEDLFQDALKGQTKNNPSALRRIRELTITSGPWDSLFAVDRKGNIVLSSIEEEIGKPVGLEPHSLPAYEEAMKGKIYHSDQVISDDTGKPTIIFSAPVRDKEDPKQAVIGTAIGHFAWPAVEEILDNMPSPSRKAHAMVVNNEGTVIACSMPDPDMVGMNMEKSSFVREVLAGRAGSAVLPANEGMLGVPSLAAYAPQGGRLSYKPNGWGLILETPLEEALADASKTAFRLVLFLMPVLLAMGGLAVWLNVKLVLKPVSLLTKTAEAIRRGDISQRAVPLSQDEIGELANTFNQMIENLSSEKKYRAFTDSAPNAIVSMDEAGCIISWNLRAEKMFGYQKDEALGKPMTLIMPERFREAHLAGLKRYRKIRESNVIGKTVELAGLKKTGEEFPVELVISSWNQESELFFTGIIHDTTERKKAEKERERLEAQLLQAQKMESIGRLTGGVAHDFNNLLGIIIGNCELAQNEAKPDGPVGEYLKDIKEAGDRAAQLTRQLLAFSRKQVLKPALLNLNDTLEETDRLFQRLIGENIQLLTVPAPDLGLVKADPNQIEQIIFNLASNARDAMPYGGKLTLETQNVVLDEQYAVHHPEVKPGPYVMMAVSDNGLGMDAKILSQIFEPFFTTKEKGKGTGMGLSMTYGIVKQSGGHIAAYSEPGKGTSFKIYLPRVEGEKQETAPVGKTPPASLAGSETVMVVEDEEKLRKFIGRVLREKGYTVLEAPSGQEALRMSESFPKPVALLVTDVILRGLSGPQTAERLIIERPDMKVLYISGYTDNAIVHHGVLEEGTNFLQKPFTPEALARKVREVLETTSHQFLEE